jgi:hypothetical protein
MCCVLQGCFFFLTLVSGAVADDVTLHKILGQECEQATLARQDVHMVTLHPGYLPSELGGMKVGSCAESGFRAVAATESVRIPVLNALVTVTHMKRSMWDLASLKAQSWLISPLLLLGHGGTQKYPISQPASKRFLAPSLKPFLASDIDAWNGDKPRDIVRPNLKAEANWVHNV